ncbi:pyridoxamine 5'-phosphate oxidase family protein [Streptomyces sp. NPDC048506]|uniref:pyridoxamine 5'-phosphate oxidase family protein n=1 Tax=Streptomyces sp. NPDC048506 TaxID=3155028 RepID=UPI003439C355
MESVDATSASPTSPTPPAPPTSPQSPTPPAALTTPTTPTAPAGDALPRKLPETDRTRHRRLRDQGSLDRAALDAVLAAGFLCHLGVVVDGTPLVVPTVYGATDSTLYFHGSVASRSLVASPGASVCVTVTHVDGLVLARSVFEHGVNYRSAMVFGTPRLVTDPEEKLAGLRRLTEQAAPGQWDYARRPNRKELAATALLALSLDEASVKVRTGPPDDGTGPDAELGLWAGVLPLHTSWGPLQPDPLLPAGIAAPGHLAGRDQPPRAS